MENEKTTVQMPQPFEKPRELMAWSSPMRHFEEKTHGWFIALGLFTVLFALLLAIVAREYSLAVVVLAFGFAVYALSSVAPAIVEHKIFNTGIQTAGKKYVWKDLESFWVGKEQEKETLFIRAKTGILREIIILLSADQNREEMEKTLLQYLPYHQKPHTDYLRIFDGFIASITRRLPKKITEPSVKTNVPSK